MFIIIIIVQVVYIIEKGHRRASAGTVKVFNKVFIGLLSSHFSHTIDNWFSIILST